MCVWRFGCCERHGVWVEDHGAGSIQRWRFSLDWEGKGMMDGMVSHENDNDHAVGTALCDILWRMLHGLDLKAHSICDSDDLQYCWPMKSSLRIWTRDSLLTASLSV
jgi:hypothetical protein